MKEIALLKTEMTNENAMNIHFRYFNTYLTIFNPIDAFKTFKTSWLKSFSFSISILFLLILVSFKASSQTASFTSNVVQGCSPLSVDFTDSSVGATSWTWDLGNSNTSTNQNPSANYPQPGLYTVTLTINGGGSPELVSTQTISVYPAPNPIIPAAVQGCEPLTTTLTAVSIPVVIAPFTMGSSSVGGITGGAVTSYTWNFLGILPTVTQSSPILNLTDIPAGNYNVILIATDEYGCSTTIFKPSALIVNPKPVTDFTYIKASQCGTGNVTFSGNATISSGTIANYAWDIGNDGTIESTNKNFTYNFTSPGAYDVKFTSTSEHSCTSDPVIKQILFNSNNTTSFSFSGNCVGQPVVFTNLSSATAVSWAWDFDNNGTIDAINQNPSYAYSSTGSYTAKLTTTFSDGCVMSTTMPVSIIGATASYSYSTVNACAPGYAIGFTSTSVVTSGSITGYAWDFDNNGTTDSNAPNPSHNFNAPGTFPVRLTVTSSDGCTNSVLSNVVITPTVVDFSASVLQGCIPLNSSFSAIYTNVSDPITSYAWNFGDPGSGANNTSALPNPSHNYTIDGKFTVSLTVTTSHGCTLSSTKSQYILAGSPQVISNVTYVQPSQCKSGAVLFTANITNKTDQLIWSFIDGTSNFIQTVSNQASVSLSHNFAAPGPQSLTVQAWYNGCPASPGFTVNNVIVNEPYAGFTPSSTVQCSVPTAAITFNNTSISTDGVTNYTWDFGDGQISTLKSPTHSYATAGNFTVRLTADNIVTGCSDQATAIIYVYSSTPLFTANTPIICEGSTISFTNQVAANSSSNFNIASYLWTFGDGQTSTQANPSHTYTTPGLYTVSLTVRESRGCTYTYTRTDYIDVRGPIADYSNDPSRICAGQTVTFHDESTKAGNDPSTSNTYLWSFGDGTTSTEQNPVHVYNAIGIYTVSLQVTDNNGCYNTKTVPGNVVVPAVYAGFTTTRNIYCSDPANAVNFTDNSIGTIVSYDWDLDGNDTYEIINGPSNPSHIYSIPGVYTIKQRVTSDLGCVDEFSKVIRIVTGNAGIFIASTNLGCAPGLANFQATDPSSVVASYHWDYGDGSFSTDANPSHFFVRPGNFTVTLTETLTGGCTKSSSIGIFVDGPVGVFSFDDSPDCSPQSVLFSANGLGSVNQLTWDFGDGFIQVQAIPGGVTSASITHTYTTWGSRLPILILHNATCGDYSYTYGNNIRTNTSEAPNPAFSFASVSGQSCQNSSVQFTDLTTKVDPRYSISTWDWDFGDGTAHSTIQNPTHIYVLAGTYTVTLVVGNGFVSGGCNATISKSILVNPLPVATSTPSTQEICSGTSSVDMVLTSSIANSTFNWTRTSPAGITTSQPSSGTGIAIGGSIPAYSFTNSTNAPITVTYNITPIGPGPTFCIGNQTIASVTINPIPTVNSANAKTICNNSNVSYTITSAVSGTTFTWTASLLSTPAGGTVNGISASGSGNLINDNLGNTGTSPGVIRYVITPTGPANTFCGGPAFNFDVTVNPTPTAIASPASQLICSSTSTNIALSTGTTGAVVNYSWTTAVISGSVTGLSNSSGNTIAQTLINTSTAQSVVRYTITPAIGTCTGTPITVDITVNPTGQVLQPLNQYVCNTENSSVVNFATLVTDGVTTYDWTNNNISTGFPFSTGSGNIPAFTAVNAGTSPVTATFVVTPTYTNGGLSCSGPTKTFNIIANPTGQVNQPSDVVFCNSSLSSVTFTTANTGGATTYAWTNSNTAIGLAANGNGNISFTTTNGTTSPISATITVTPTFSNGGASCVGPGKTFTITVNPTSQVNKPANQVLCSNSPTTQVSFTTNNVVGTTTYTWTNNNATIGLSASGSGDIPSFNATNAGTSPVTATIVVTPTFTYLGKSCTGPTQSFTITVNPIPTVNSAAAKSICNNTNVSYIPTSAVAGATFAWTAVLTSGTVSGFSASGTGVITDVLVNSGTGNGVVTYTIIPSGPSPTSCTGPSFSFAVTVRPTPDVIATPASQTTCSGAAINIVLSTGVPGTTFYYAAPTISGAAGNITGGTARVSPGNTNPITNTLVNTTGTIQSATYTVFPIINGCIGTAKTVVITVNPVPVISNGLAQGLCTDALFTTAASNLTITTTPNVAGTLFTYSAPVNTGGMTGGTARLVGSTAPITDIFVNNTNTTQTATYSVLPTAPAALGGCVGTAKNVVISVYPRALITSTLSRTACSGSPFAYTITSNVASSTFTWTRAVVPGISNLAGSGVTSAITETLINTTANSIDVSYVLTPKGPAPGNCTGTPSTLVVTVNSTPAVSNMTLAAICGGGSFTASPVNGTNGIVPSGTTYTWSAPVVAGITGTASGTDAANISGTLNNTTNAAINVIYTVTPKSGSCPGSTFTVTVPVNPTPAINNMSLSAICSGGLFTASPANVTNGIVPTGTTYSWTAPVVAGISGTTSGTDAANISGTLTNTTNSAINVVYTVTPKSGTCIGSTFTVTVLVNPTPVISNMSIASICGGGSFTASPANGTNGIVPSGTTYSWSAPVVAGITGTASGTNAANISGTLNNTTNAAINVVYTITPKSGSCTGSTFTLTVPVNPTPAIGNMSLSAICNGGSFTATPANGTNGIVPAGTTYTWPAPVVAGITGTASGTDAGNISGTLINTTNAAINVVYTVTPKSGTCSGSTFTVTIPVTPTPAINSMNITAICGGGSFTASPVNGTDGIVPVGTTYSWSAPVVAGITGTALGTNAPNISGTLTNATNSAINVVYTITPKSGSCTGSTFTVTVPVNPTPAITNMSLSAICGGGSFTATPANGTNGIVPSGTTYSWSAPVVAGITGTVSGTDAATISGTLNNTTNSTINVVYTVTPKSGTCTGSTFTVSVPVNPTIAITNMSITAICGGGSFTATPTNGTNGVVPSGTTYNWSAPVVAGITGTASGTDAVNISGTLGNTTNTAISVVYTVTPKSGTCTGSTFTVTVQVNPTPAITNMTLTAICGGGSFTASPTNGTNGIVPTGTTYSWSAPVVAGITGTASGTNAASISGTLSNSTNSTINVVYTVTPKSGSCTGSTFTVTVPVNSGPSFSVCPSNISQNTDANQCNSIVNYTATAVGTPLPTLTYTFSGATTGSGSGTGSGSTFNHGITSVVITASSGCGSANCSFNVTITDKEKPVIICPSAIIQTADAGICGALLSITNPTATDNCSATFTYSGIRSDALALSAVYPVGNTTITWTVTDESGNISLSCNQLITITDNEKPVILCPANITRSTDSGVCGASIVITNPTATDNCSSSFTFNGTRSDALALLADYPVGITTIRWTATDGAGNTSLFCDQTVTVNDNEKPVIICPANISQTADSGVCGATVAITNPTATDNCSVSFTFNGIRSDALALSNDYPVGNTTIQWTATDASGNISLSCNQTITITDNEKPLITCPADISQVADAGLCGATVSITTPTATDNCSSSFIFAGVRSDALALSAIYPVGNTTISWTATDASGNISSACIQTINVTDNQKPVIVCPADITQVADLGICGATISITNPTATDNCSNSFTFSGVRSDALALTDIYPEGVTTISWTATDAAGNTSLSCTQTITVTDDQKPVITCPVDITKTVDAGICSAAITILNPTATDNCSISFIFTGVRSDLLPLTSNYPIGNTTISWTATDESGNVSISCDQIVTVTDNQKPTITAPATVFVNSDIGVCFASGVNLGTPITADNCSVANVTNDAVQPFALGNTVVTWTVTDGSGNSETATQIVTVTDDQNPTIVAPAAVSVNSDAGQCSASGVILGTPVTADNCSVASVTNDAVEPFVLGNTTVTWTVTDGSGNINTATQQVLVTDGQNPTITAPADVTVNSDAGLCSASGVILGTPVTADNCSVASVSNDAVQPFALGSTTVTWTVIDGGGNSETATQIVTVTDNQKPTITAPAAVFINSDAGLCSASGVILGTPITDDNCSVASVSNDAVQPFALGNTTVTWTVTDGSGNSEIATQVVTVTDNQKPVIVCPANISKDVDLGICGTSVLIADPSATDNCSTSFVFSGVRSDGKLLTDVYPVGITTISWTATDSSGNISESCTQTVTVTDSEKPVAVCKNIIVNLDASGNASITANDINNGSSDNCGIQSVSASKTLFNCSETGPNNVTLTVYDKVGNYSTCNAVVTVTDTNGPSISVGDITYNENDGSVLFTVRMVNPRNCDVSFSASTADGSALAGSDYVSKSPSIYTIPAGSTSVSIIVPLVNDNIYELPEIFYLNLSNPINCKISDNQGICTILDDDTKPTITIADASSTEGSPVMFKLSLSNPSFGAITLTLGLTNGTAGSSDYDTRNISITIPAGTDKFSVPVATFQDLIDEKDETFTISVISVDSGIVGSYSDSATGTIIDDENYPVAVNDNVSTAEDNPVTIMVLINDTFGDDGPAAGPITVKNASHGNVSVDNGGTPNDPKDDKIIYIPDPNYNGPDSFEYTICDPTPDCSTATVNINVISVKDNPIANDDGITTLESVSIINATVTGNDFPSGDGGNVWSLIGDNGGANNGSVVMSPDGTYNYIPNPFFNGVDSFTYQICDSDNDCDSAVVIITITSVNDKPVAVNDVFYNFEDIPILGETVATNDIPSGDGGNVWSLVGDNGGALNGKVIMYPDGRFDYYPNPNFNGTEEFFYQICDIDGDCETAIVTIILDAVGDVPYAEDDMISTMEDTPIIGAIVTDNDVPSGDGGNIWSLFGSNGGASHGKVIMNTNGTFNYTPDLNYVGTDKFIYHLCDVDGDCSYAQVIITVSPMNDPPIAKNDINITFVGRPVAGNVLVNDNDPDGDALKINTTPLDTPKHGSVLINPDGTYTYTPESGYTGNDSFTYEVCDNGTPSLCDQATVTISVIEKTFENSAPVAVNDVYQGSMGLPVVGNVISNDFDLDGNLNMNSVTIIGSDPANESFNLNTNGSFTYVPVAGFIGTVTFDYRVCDLGTPALCDVGTVTIEILPNPDKNSTFANDDSYLGHEDHPISGNLLNNDNDPEGDIQTVNTVPISSPKHGTVSLNSNGTFTYIPTPNFFGTDYFVYEICDSGTPKACDQASVYLIVEPLNDPPVAEDDINIIFKGKQASGNVLTNDSDPEGDQLIIKTNPVISPANGNVVINSDGTYTYTPNSGFTGMDSFVYEVCDDGIPVMCDQAKVTIKVIDLIDTNNAPVAINDAYQGSIGLTVSGNVISNDFDPDGNLNPNSVTLLGSAPVIGKLTLNQDGTFIYIPETGFLGRVTFDYRICDTGNPSLCDVATVSIEIQANPNGNTTFAVDDSFFGIEDHSVSGNLLKNDYDPEGDIQTVNTSAVVIPKHGTVTINANGSFTYIPFPNYFGQDRFVYEVCDNGTPKACDQGTVYLIIAPQNNPPIASDDIGITFKDEAFKANLLTNDNDPDGNLILINTIPVKLPSNGTVVIQPDGSYTYTPNSGFIGTDSFVYEICDNGNPVMCDQATVTINIIESTDKNDAPVAVNDVYKGSIGLPVRGNVISNDFDVDGNLNFNSVTLTGSAPANGAMTLNPDGTFIFVPVAGFLGQVSFVYRICDLGTPPLCDEATVTIEILANPTNNSTFATDDSFEGVEDNPLSGNLLANDNDPEGDTQTLNVNPVVLPIHGSVILNTNGTFTYTPELNFFGTDRFVYEVCDNGIPQACDVANVILIIIPGNDIPLAVDDNFSMKEDTILSGNIGLNDILSNDGGNIWAIVQQPEHGSLVINPDGSFIYTPVPDFNGTDHFIYKLCDVDGDCTEAKVTITVNPANDVPIASNDSFTYHLDGILEASVADNDMTSGDGGNIWTITTQPASGSVVFNPDGTFTYTPFENFIGFDSFMYQLCDKDGDCSEAKVTIDIEDVVPNQIFTPNGDGQNDTYHIEGIEYFPGNSLTIFNRWGNVVYKKSGYLNDWDGYSNVSKVGRSALPVGTYFYVLDYGKNKHKSGYVYLER